MVFKVVVPQIGESVTEAEMGEWHKSDGDMVDVDEELCTIESEKAALEITAGHAGRLKIVARTGAILKIGDTIGEIDTDAAGEVKGDQPEPPAVEPGEAADTDKTAQPGPKIRITPVAKRILEDAGIPLDRVIGSGPAGRITKADAVKAMEEKPVAAEPAEPVLDTAAKVVEPLVADGLTVSGEEAGKRRETRERMSTLRRTIARHMVSAKNDTAMLTTINEVDMSAILELRKQLKDEFLEKYGVKLGFMSFFGRAVSIALGTMPVVNSRVDGNDIIYHHYVDISIAVSTEKGLVAPVVRGVDGMGLGELERGIQEMAAKARDGKLTLEEMSGGTFTITNGGVFGSLISTPIINVPQSAILGMHTIQERPVARDGEVVIRPMMYVALSYDHRIIDGRESVLFLGHVKKLLENPARMLLEL